MLVVDFTLSLKVSLQAELVDEVLVQHSFSDYFDFCFCEVARVFPVKYLEYLDDVLTKVLLVHLLQHVQ